MSSSPFPDHYERTCIDGKEHPADVVIGNLPRIKRHTQLLSKLSESLRLSVRKLEVFIAYVHARGVHQSLRENLFFNAGFKHGLLADSHVTVKMTEHYSHVDVDEKRAAVEGMLSLVRGGDETPPSNENLTAQDITGMAETGTLADTSTEKAGSSEESVAKLEQKTA